MTPGDRLLLLLARSSVGPDARAQAVRLAREARWSELAERALVHGLAPLVARHLDALGWPGVPDAARESLEAARRVNAARSLLAARELHAVLEALAAAGVRVIPLKGVALAESLFRDAALRVSNDVDVLVPRADAVRACSALADRGYAPAGHEAPLAADDLGLLLDSNMEYALVSPRPGASVVELHWDIAWRWAGGRAALDDLWAAAVPRPFRGAPAHALSSEWELLYLAVHAARHRWQSLKWLVDVHEICARGRLDWARAQDTARRFGLRAPLAITLGAAARLLGTPVPVGVDSRVPAWLELFPESAPDLGRWRGALYPARLFPRPADKLGYLARVLLRPTLTERRLVRLPPTLAPLYYPLRPLRLGGRWARDVVREAYSRAASGLTRLGATANHRAPGSGTRRSDITGSSEERA